MILFYTLFYFIFLLFIHSILSNLILFIFIFIFIKFIFIMMINMIRMIYFCIICTIVLYTVWFDLVEYDLRYSMFKIKQNSTINLWHHILLFCIVLFCMYYIILYYFASYCIAWHFVTLCHILFIYRYIYNNIKTIIY